MPRRTYADNAMNRSLGRVGMAHGTAVHSRSGGSFSSYGGSSSYSSSSVLSSTSSPRTYVDNATNRSLGRVGKVHGTHVVHKDGSISSGSSYPTASSYSSPRTYVDNATNRSVGRVGKEVGTHVIHKDGSATVSSTNTSASSTSSSNVYEDNRLNRKLGRVGKQKGTHILHKDGTVTISSGSTTVTSSVGIATQKYYVNNAYNRKLGRVGQPIPSRRIHKERTRQEVINESTLEEVREMLRELSFRDPDYPNVVMVQYQLQRDEVEEKWRQDGIQPSTDYSEAAGYQKEIIPLVDIEISRQIGEGGFGKVYAGLWKKKTPIAFKKFIWQQITKKKLDALVKEIQIFSSLNHTNVVKMFGVVMDKDNVGIVMEYLPKTLFHAIFMEEVEFNATEKHRILTEIVFALEYLHVPWKSRETREPIAHCDIKAQNILLDCNNVAKLCDFGLSAMKRSAESSSSRSSAAPGQGTPRYAAPEVLRGEMLSIHALMMSDVYSLSLVVYELLVEEEVYEDLGIFQLVENVGKGSLRPSLEKANLSEPVKQLLTTSWDVVAVNRPDISQFSQKMAKLQYHLYF